MSRNQLYIDQLLRILDPSRRDLAPEVGARGYAQAEVRGVDVAARTVTALVSTPNVDRYGEIVEPEAFRESLPIFMRNPVLIAGHQYTAEDGSCPVIGKWLSMTITKEGLLGTCEFMSDDALADSWFKRFAQKCIRAFSVGFLSQATEFRSFKMPDGSTKKLRVHTLAELIEVSAVAIPANRESLVIGASLGGLRRRGNDGSGDDDDALTAGGKLSNRQVAIATRALTPVIRDILKAELNPEPGTVLYTILGMFVEAVDSHRGFGSDTCHEQHGHHDHDEDDTGDPDDEDLNEALSTILAGNGKRRR